MTDPEPRSATSRPWWRHLWLAGLVLYAAVIWWIGWDRLAAAVAGADVYWLAATIALLVIAQWIRAWKWRVALGPGRNAIAVHFLSKAGGELSPGRIGEFAPLLLKEHRSAGLAAWIAVDRVLEIVVTLALGAAGLVALQIPERGLLLAVAVGLTVAGIALLYAMAQGHWFEALAVGMPAGSRRSRIALLLASAGREVRASYRRLPLTTAITFAACLLDILIGYALFHAFGYAVGLPLLAVCKVLHALVSAVPITPNATGVPALTVAYLLHEQAGLSPEALAASIGLSFVLTALVFWTSFALALGTWRRR